MTRFDEIENAVTFGIKTTAEWFSEHIIDCRACPAQDLCKASLSRRCVSTLYDWLNTEIGE